MWGVRAPKSLKTESASTDSIPGFSKWYVNEVIFQNQLLEQHAKKFDITADINREWLDIIMDDIMNSRESDIILPLNEDNKEVELETEGMDQQHEDRLQDVQEEQKIIETTDTHSSDNKTSNEIFTKNVADDSMLLMLRSPTKFRSTETSPMRKLHLKELEIMKQPVISTAIKPTTVFSNDGKTKDAVIHNINENEIPEVTTEPLIQTEQHLPQPAFERVQQDRTKQKKEETTLKPINERASQSEDISFDFISKNIRKSMALRQSMHYQDEDSTNSTESQLQDVKGQAEHNVLTTDHNTITTNIIGTEIQAEDKKPGDKSLVLSESDDDIDLSELTRIMLPRTLISTVPVVVPPIRSPIKFAELPSREPPSVKPTQKKKSSIRKSSIRKAPMSQSFMKNAVNTDRISDDPSPFKDKLRSNTTADSFSLKLPPSLDVPSPSYSSGEPTIKINRQMNIKSPSPLNSQRTKRDNLSPSGLQAEESSLLSRLMLPTQASAQRSRKSPIRKGYSPMKINSRTPNRVPLSDSMMKSTLLKSIKLDKREDPASNRTSPNKSSHNTPSSASTFATSTMVLPSILANSKILKPIIESKLSSSKLVIRESKINQLKKIVSSSTSTTTSRIPLTEQALQPRSKSIGRPLLHPSQRLMKSGSPESRSLIDLSKKLEKRKKSEHMLHSKKLKMDNNNKLKQIPVRHPKLNQRCATQEPLKKQIISTDLPANNNTSTLEMSQVPPPSIPSTFRKKSGVAYKSPDSNNPHDLPEINSDTEEEDKQLCEWGTDINIVEQLRKQSSINPTDIFGRVQKVNCNEIFGKVYFSNMNIVWNETDKLSQKELDEYDRRKGWI